MKHKVLSVALPILLISGVGCSKEDTEKKKTDSLQVAEAESNKKALETVNKEVDKLRKEKDELEKKVAEAESDKRALETANKEVDKLRKEKDELEKKIVKEPGIKEQESKEKDSITDVHSPITIKQYQEKMETLVNQFSRELQATKPIFAKDQTLKTNQVELKKQFEVVKGELRKLKELDPPKAYDYFKVQLRDDVKIIEICIEQIFVGLDEKDNEKVDSSLKAMYGHIDDMGLTLNEIRKLEG
ncbi:MULTISPECIES: coiled-coil domain-containing protein [Bacillus cereus group]|uniref:Lipoprotein n=1 Tax=Bacillus thuringiensis serovar iberica TaxID=180866 RepID=A0A9X6QL32_BACTU|nr:MULTISPECIES: hypothetical protein [Bacillus cereus group]HDR5354240.1 hypothetical protein [Bacillus thuringiensis]MDZ4542595.1 hypothetical protein [Bacillus cereus]MEB9623939.1 hypothetical protein [Bacillus cereus]OUB43007.1 hypothetical protein BK741_24545 [Bacillus thuringiensis serovar iberica]PEV28807.1 hypothetical protein CN419_22070 [Bacillus cereus]